MRGKRGGLAVPFFLGSTFDRLKVAKELFTGRDQLDSVFRVGGWAEVGNVHDVILAHAQHHQASPNWLLKVFQGLISG